MKEILFSLMIVALLALTACASPRAVGTTPPSSSDQVATVVAATLQALPTNTSEPTPEAPAELLPHTLYYLSNDGIYRRDDGTLLSQVYRMERDGKTNTRLTNEPNGVDGYDVSLVDGTVAFITDNQLVLVNADGSNRRVLVDGGSARIENNPYFYKDPLSRPVFSPDGQTIAYAHGHRSLTLYDISSSVSTTVLKDENICPVFAQCSPVQYSPDGTKLLLAVPQWEAAPVFAVYYPETGALVRPTRGERDFCCGEPLWSSDGSSFYGAAFIPQYAYRTGEIWWVDSATGAVTTLFPFDANNETMSIPDAPYLAPDGQLYYFFGSYRMDSGYFEPPVLQLVRSAPDGVTDRTVIRNENFVLMNEALWAPDASFVIVASAPRRDWHGLGILELYYTDGQKSPVWLAPFGSQMKWGP